MSELPASVVLLANPGLATSGTTVRRWVRGETILHHIIDPTTGLPADSVWRTATVVAGSCVDANIASTAAIVLSDRALAWLEERKLAARLIDRDGGVHLVGTIVRGQRGISVAELRRQYKGWSISIEPDSGTSKSFLARKVAS